MHVNHDFSPFHWVDCLKIAATAQLTTDHHYIAASEKGGHFQVLNRRTIEESGKAMRKLSVPEIIQISCEILSNLFAEYGLPQKTMPSGELFELSNNIFYYSYKLIAAREMKRDTMIGHNARGMIWYMRKAFYLTNDESPLSKKKNQETLDFEEENLRLRKQVEILKEFPIVKELRKRLEKFPSVISETLREMKEEDLCSFISHHLNQSVKEKLTEPSIPCISIFRQDLERGLSFIRQDQVLQICDSDPIPRQELTPHQMEREAIGALFALTNDEIWWEAALQAAASQTSRNALFRTFKGIFLSRIESDTWLENEINYSLAFEFCLEPQPITLRIIRDPATGKIQESIIVVQDTGNILKVEFSKALKTREIIYSHIMTGKMQYSIIRSEEDLPIIKNIHFSFESAYTQANSRFGF